MPSRRPARAASARSVERSLERPAVTRIDWRRTSVCLSSENMGNRCKLGGRRMAFSSCLILVACARTAMVVVACGNLGAGPFTSSTINYVAELFTSQGCAYCPRADQWLAAIARAPDVVAVSFPVDYGTILAGAIRSRPRPSRRAKRPTRRRMARRTSIPRKLS